VGRMRTSAVLVVLFLAVACGRSAVPADRSPGATLADPVRAATAALPGAPEPDAPARARPVGRAVITSTATIVAAAPEEPVFTVATAPAPTRSAAPATDLAPEPGPPTATEPPPLPPAEPPPFPGPPPPP
jgi:hypothetical protein